MKFNSTRNADVQATGKEAVLYGLASDGGLFVPEYFPRIDLEACKDMDYPALAKKIFSLYFDDFAEIEEVVDVAKSRFPDPPVKVDVIGNIAFLELFYGPTLAFKDMALSVLPGLVQEAAKDFGKTVRVLTATSGDTGKAALEGFRDIPGTQIMIFFPNNGVSPMQKLQMMTQEGENVFVFPIEGNFDDAQRGVKTIFEDEALKSRLDEEGIILSSANSINIGRLIPQVVYYVYAYLNLRREGKIQEGEKINISVPTGNFGNILAAYYAKRMGLPIGNLICASNDNRVLTDFFQDKHYQGNRELICTSSPSMDILISSNLERYLYHLTSDAKKTKKMMDDLKTKGEFFWEEEFPEDIFAYSFDEEGVSKSIKAAWESGKVLDPHSAISYGATKAYQKETGDDAFTLVVCTADPYKFPEKILQSLGEEADAESFAQLKALEDISGRPVPEALWGLRRKPIRHNKVIDPEEMPGVVEKGDSSWISE